MQIWSDLSLKSSHTSLIHTTNIKKMGCKYLQGISGKELTRKLKKEGIPRVIGIWKEEKKKGKSFVEVSGESQRDTQRDHAGQHSTSVEDVAPVAWKARHISNDGDARVGTL